MGLTTTTSTSMSSRNKEILPLDGNKAWGCPGKRLLSLVILPDVGPLAWDALQVKLEEDQEWDRQCKLDPSDPLCMKSENFIRKRIQLKDNTLIKPFKKNNTLIKRRFNWFSIFTHYHVCL